MKKRPRDLRDTTVSRTSEALKRRRVKIGLGKFVWIYARTDEELDRQQATLILKHGARYEDVRDLFVDINIEPDTPSSSSEEVDIPENPIIIQNNLLQDDMEEIVFAPRTLQDFRRDLNTNILYLSAEGVDGAPRPFFFDRDNDDNESVAFASANAFARVFNDLNQTSINKYSSSGSFHSLVLITEFNAINPERPIEVFMKTFSKFKITTLLKYPIATMSFNVASRDHNYGAAPVLNTLSQKAIYLANTGALNGLTPKQMTQRFTTFKIQLICTRGGHQFGAADVAFAGAKVFSLMLPPMPIDILVGENTFNDADDSHDWAGLSALKQNLYQVIEENLFQIAAKEHEWGSSEDNSDIPNYNDLLAEVRKEDVVNFKTAILARRIDECVIKFFPLMERPENLNGDLVNVEPANYRSIPLNPNMPLTQVSIPALGDSMSLRANAQYISPNGALMDMSPYLTTLLPTTQYNAVTNEAFDALTTTVANIAQEITPRYIPIGNHESLTHITVNVDRRPNPSALFAFEQLHDDPQSTFGIHPEEDDVDEEIERHYHVGCIVNPADRLDKYFLRLTHLWNPPEDEFNDCFFRCWANATDNYFTREDALEKRKIMNLTSTQHVPLDSLQLLSDALNEVYHVWNIVDTTESDMAIKIDGEDHIAHASKVFKEIATFNPEKNLLNLKHYHFLFFKGHSYHITNPKFIIDKVKCRTCTQWIGRSTMMSHSKFCFYCKVCRRAYSTKNKAHECLGERQTFREINAAKNAMQHEKVCEDWITTSRGEFSKKLSPENTIFLADIETFPDVENNFQCIAYKCAIQGLARGERQYQFSGPNCLGEFLDHCRSLEGTIYFYNGGRFDCYLVIQAMINRGDVLDSSSFIKNSGCIMSFAIHRRLKVHDLCLFVDGSLARACKDWGVPKELSKGEFDHSKIYSWESAAEHDKEVSEYLKFDVVSLRELFRIYTKAQFDCFKVDVNRSISLSQYAYKVWSAGVGSTMNSIYVPHKGKEENDDRAAYYGGRVAPQRLEFISKDYVKSQTHYDYESITDYLIYPDVNSLYPAACRTFKYAFGFWKYLSTEEIADFNFMERLNNIEQSDDILKCCYCVDVTCPKDLITPFLMERTSNGSLLHTLKDKVKQWYWGSELLEAILIGYHVTTVHEVKQFSYYGPLFKDFIDLCWQGRIDNPKPSVKNLSFKNTMNKLTGKFGQKAHATNTTILSAKSKTADKDAKKIIENLEDFDLLFDENGDNHAIILEVTNKNPHPTYPIYLSAQILANSRVIMSRVYRQINAYLDPECAIYYTDTDSLIINGKTLDKLKEANMIGSGLGQLSCDLSDGTDGTFAKILTGIWAAPKGPYTLGFINPKGDGRMLEKVKAKGIPHPSGPFPYGEEIKITFDEKGQDLSNRITAWLREPSKYTPPIDDLKSRFYHYQTTDEKNNYFAKHINHDIIKLILAKEGTLSCYYGSFKKEMVSSYGNVLSLTPLINSRMLCRNDWWMKSNRIFLTDEPKSTDLTYPEDYVKGRTHFDTEFDSLVREAEEMH